MLFLAQNSILLYFNMFIFTICCGVRRRAMSIGAHPVGETVFFILLTTNKEVFIGHYRSVDKGIYCLLIKVNSETLFWFFLNLLHSRDIRVSRRKKDIFLYFTFLYLILLYFIFSYFIFLRFDDFVFLYIYMFIFLYF